MSNFTLQVFMTILVWVNHLDSTEFRYWFAIPADVKSYMRILKEKIKLPIAEIKAELWEDMFCAMSDRHGATDNEIIKIIGKSADKIDSATVEIHLESMAHSGGFRKELIAKNSYFRGWSITLHNVIEKEIDSLSKDMIVAMAETYYNATDGGGDPRYGLRRNNQSKQTDA